MKTPDPVLFGALLAAALLFFVWSFYRRMSQVALGKPENRFDRPGRRLWEMWVYAFAQRRVVAKPFGMNHFVLFWSFIVLLLANGEFMVRGVLPQVRLALLPAPIYHAILVALDVVSLMTLGCMVLSFGRRLLVRPAHLDTPYVTGRSFEAFLILGFITLLMLAYFGLHGVEIALKAEPAAAFLPVSGAAAAMMDGLGTDTLEVLGAVFWWIHGLVLLAFLCFLPHSKHMHILTAIPNCFFRNLASPNTQPREEFSPGNRFGVSAVEDFTWKDLFDSFSCTECGRYQEACPALATGKPLNPRQVVHSLKVNLLANAESIRAKRPPVLPLVGPEAEGSSTEDTLWSCTTCGACMTACPVFIEQMPKIVKMRRHLVEMESRFPDELLNFFENMEQRSNPWGIAPGERVKWCSQMDVKPFEAGKTEYLLYVGCAGSFDSRQKQVTVALATLLDAAGVSWGTLGKEEKCCGDSLRRLGNEYVFDQMAKENVELLRKKGVTRVIAPCPHCFSTLKNDYRQYGLDVEVLHHAELIERLLREGKLKLTRPVRDLGRIAFHDSCYLGRHNGVYEAPRAAVARATGEAPAEVPRRRENGFCCGAGGGRMWMEEKIGTRINLARVEETLKTQPDTVCVCCPYCLTMFEDGMKDLKAERVKVKDLAEVVAEGLRQ